MREAQGVHGVAREVQGDLGEWQVGGGRGACACMAATRPPAYWQEVEDDREEPLVGWAGQLQYWADWWAPGKFCQVSPFSFYLCFLIPL